MGRDSRRKKERRERLAASGRKESYRAIRRGHNAEMFGRTVGSDLADFEAAARRGQDSLAAALISRSNQRMERVGHVHPDIRGRARTIVGQLGAINLFLRMLGTDRDRPPVSHYGGWIDNLAWGSDSMVSVIRLLLCGQVVGASQVARSQMERWAFNLEHNAHTSRIQGESTVDYFNRLWSTWGTPRPAMDASRQSRFRHVTVGDRLVRAGQLYGDISELLHGRGTLIDAVTAESAVLLADVELLSSPRVLQASNQILDVVELCVERIATCVKTELSQTGGFEHAIRLKEFMDTAHPSGDRPYLAITLWPIMPGPQLYRIARMLKPTEELTEAIDRGERPLGRLFTDEEMSDIFFGYRRYRSFNLAITAYEYEAHALSKPVESLDLSDRHYNQIIVAEVLGLISRWSDDEHVRAAAAVVSSGIRSAFWLWLEDDNRAMGVLRAVLEQCARLRTHVRKAAKARRLEDRGEQTTPRDWLDAAGWRELNALNKALGELAHTRPTSRWEGARDLLVALLPDADTELAPHGGRTFAVDAMVRLASRTALEVLQGISPMLRDHAHSLMSNTGIFNEEVEQNINAWLSRSNALRDFDYGESTFLDPPDDQTALPPEEYERLMRSAAEGDAS